MISAVLVDQNPIDYCDSPAHWFTHKDHKWGDEEIVFFQ